MADEVATEAATETPAAPAAWSRADTLKALEANEHVEAKPAADAKADPPAAEAEASDDDTDTETETDEDEDGDAGEGDADESDDEEPDAEPAPKADADLEARLAKVQTAERRAREQLARERQEALAEVQRARDEVKADVEAAKQWAKLRDSAPYDLAPALALLGIPESEYMHHARALAAMAPENKADPKNRDMVERLARERRMADELATTKRRLDEMEQRRLTEDQQAESARQTEAYLDAVVAVKADAPLARAALKADPKETRRELAAVALELLERTGEPPEHAAVLAAYEKRETARLKRLGIDPATIAKKSAAPAKPDDKAPAATAKKPATGKKPEAKKAAEPPPNETLAQRRARIQKDLEEGNINFD